MAEREVTDHAHRTGALVVVATPIGNLGDLAPRAVEELAAADLICCEDTRRTGQLLTHAGVTRPALRRVDAHTEAGVLDEVVARIAAGERVVLVSDAGTPTVSDPGARLVQAVAAADLPVSVVPGPVAAIAALVISGLDTARFVVEGFLPRKGADRSARLAEVGAERRTTVLYEAPNRVAATLGDLAAACGPDRPAAVARELTKRFEEVWRAPLGELAARANDMPPRGEVVIVVAGAAGPVGSADDEVRAALLAARRRGLSPGRAAADVAAALGRTRAEVYALALAEPSTGDDEGDDTAGADEDDGADTAGADE